MSKFFVEEVNLIREIRRKIQTKRKIRNPPKDKQKKTQQNKDMKNLKK